ncbi:MAG: cell wall-binding repeat-containing protein [Actinobacteria bacterium]|nr:cell wall-binding repeat-containing protein [Actinomycetota bacterium]
MMRDGVAKSGPDLGFKIAASLLLMIVFIAALPPIAAASLPGGYYSVWRGPNTHGAFSWPLGMAVDASGDLFVADAENHRILKLSPTGSVLQAWGSRGSSPGQFQRPEGVAVGLDGRIYVTDTGNNRIQVFSPSGSLVDTWTAAGTLSGPTGIAVDAVGTVFVADTLNHRILRFTSDGRNHTVIGGPGPGWAQFSSPLGVAVDSTHLYVADSNNRRIQKLTLAGSYVFQWGPVDSTVQVPFTHTRFGTPYGIAVTGADELVVADMSGIRNDRESLDPVLHIERSSKTGTISAQWGLVGDGPGQFRLAAGVTPRSGGGVYISDTGNNRIQVLDSSWATQEVWDLSGSGPGQLRSPVAVASAPDGTIYVADEGNERIQVFGANRAFLRSIGGSGLTTQPADLAVAASGDVLVAMSGGTPRVDRFSAQGVLLGSIGSGQLTSAQGVAIAPSGDIWVADTTSARVRRFSAAGDLLQTLQPPAGTPGALMAPVDITVDASGRLWVVDQSAARVLVFDGSGGFLFSLGGFGEKPGQFKAPTGVAIGLSGQIYVGDTGNARVQRFSSAGVFQEVIGSLGAGEGQLRSPMRPAVLPNGNLIVPERDNHRLQIFEHDEGPPVTTASGFPVGWTNQPVTVTLSAIDASSGVAATFYRIASDPVQPYTGPFVIDRDMDAIVRWWSVDRMGNVEAENTRRVRMDRTPPSGTLDINGGARFTTTSTVTLNSAVVGGHMMRVDVGSGFGQWGPVWPALAVTLPGEGHRIVRTQYDDVAGNRLSLVASIAVDWTEPSTVASGLTDAWVRGPVGLSLVATDNVIGVASTHLRVGGAGPFSEHLPGSVVTITEEGATTLEWYSIDLAGNREATKTATVRIDNAPPAGTFVLAGGATYVATTSVKAVGVAPDSTEMRYTSGSMDTGWVAFEPGVSLTLDGPGTHVVTGRFRDGAGNEAVHESSVTVDLGAPTTTIAGGFDGFRARPATLTLNAVDDRSGISATFYQIGPAGPVRQYTAPIVVSTPGVTHVSFWSVDNVGNIEATRTTTVSIVERVRHEGVNRYQTAIEVSRRTFSAAGSVVLASGEDFPDALSAASLAGALEAPVLLTMRNALPDGLLAEVERLRATKVYIIGGTGAIAPEVARSITGADIAVERIGGRDRFDTAARVAAATIAKRGTVAEPGLVFVARGDDFPDAVSAAPAAFAGRVPILLARQTSVPTVTAAAIRDLQLTEAIVLGGTGAIQEQTLPGLGISALRVAGGDRYSTSAAVFDFARSRSLVGSVTVGLVTGERFPDALAGGAAIGHRRGAVLLTRPTSLSAPARDRLLASAGVVERVTVIGGQGAVTDGVVNAAMQALQ